MVIALMSLVQIPPLDERKGPFLFLPRCGSVSG